MTKRREALYIGLATLAGLYLFFLPLLPPLRKFHLIGDIEGYHYPLLNYAFKALHAGRFPLWDPTIYCGLSFAANIQAQLFYPPTWLLFAAQWQRKGLQFMALQIYTFAHLWILIQLSYWWLRSGRSLPSAAALLGSFTFALTGYLLNDMQHLGVICALAWFPLALWGVDRRRIWMIAVAGALAFLAGYPATWIALAIAVFFYALFTAGRYALIAAFAMLLSLALAGIQLVPTAELAKFRPQEPVYGNGPPLEWHLFRFFPSSNPQDQYLYYGAAFLIAIGLAAYYRKNLALPIGLAAVGWIFLQDPRQWISSVAGHVPSLIDVMQHWNFNAILSLAAALFVAVAWAPVAQRYPRLVFALIPAFAFEQYWFGATRPYFREPSGYDLFFRGDIRNGGAEFRGLNRADYDEFLAHPEFRIVFDGGFHPTDSRHYGVTTPNGFDPFLTVQFRQEVELYSAFETNRLFQIDISKEAVLQAFGVGYVVATEQSPSYQTLLQSPLFERIDGKRAYFQTFVYRNRKPTYRFDGGTTQVLHWTPELREFRVNSTKSAPLILLEQNLPGWHASVDGIEISIQTYSKAFQQVPIRQTGEHTVRFEYRPPGVFFGGILTLATGVVLLVLTRRGL